MTVIADFKYYQSHGSNGAATASAMTTFIAAVDAK